jgi:tetratricopeptide (TPR) repeat protein
VVAGVALLPLTVWLLYGSVDWFWEFPALSGPALGFLAMAMALGRPSPAPDAASTVPGLATPRRSSPVAGIAGVMAGILGLLAAVIVLAFPYLAVRETSVGSDLRQRDPAAALHALRIAADLNPLSAEPGRVAGTVALASGRYGTARQRFGQAVARDPGGWYAWLGAGLAASALGDRRQARIDFDTAAKINPKESVITDAAARVDSAHPLSPMSALQRLAQSF